MLPNTATKGVRPKGVSRRWPLYALVAAALAALALSVEAFLRAENFSPGEEIVAPGIQDVAVSAENSLYPPPDTGRFEEPPETVFVYLSVEDLPSGEDMEARVQREESGSAYALLFGRGAGLEALDEQEDHLRRALTGPPASSSSSSRPVPASPCRPVTTPSTSTVPGPPAKRTAPPWRPASSSS
ncbi:MAG: hypothetical protein M3N18_03405 [Actinomycetota bacterium]|nr:hypothetical protein [Actinomycetota bacterium]